jgi:hypothetical protein
MWWCAFLKTAQQRETVKTIRIKDPNGYFEAVWILCFVL